MHSRNKFSLKFTSWIGSSVSLLLHTVFFIGIFSMLWLGYSLDSVLLILTTLVSLEAIYLAIFIQMSINRQAEDIDEIQEDVAEITEDIDEIQEDVEDITEEIEKDDEEEDVEHAENLRQLQKIEDTLYTLIREIDEMRKKSGNVTVDK
ncbi:DUF1003 domain-containing protein [bacterium]|nr:DUF1003 domain-containing protein [bacterium]